jgi:uncharacterized membrane protein YvbJ
MRCWKCGCQNSEEREFCRKCGAELARREFDENELPGTEELDEEFDDDESEDDEY